MDAKFSPRVKDVITYSREEALRLGHNYIGVEHLLLGIIREGEGTAIRILEGLNVDLPRLRKMVEGSITPASVSGGNPGNIPLVKQAEKILKITYLEAKTFKSPVIGTEHLLLSILKDENNVATKALLALNVDYDEAKQEFESILTDGKAIPAPCRIPRHGRRRGGTWQPRSRRSEAAEAPPSPTAKARRRSSTTSAAT